eukprot:scaffold12884_cov111-Isochrysis_galbana.AAC.4
MITRAECKEGSTRFRSSRHGLKGSGKASGGLKGTDQKKTCKTLKSPACLLPSALGLSGACGEEA